MPARRPQSVDGKVSDEHHRQDWKASQSYDPSSSSRSTRSTWRPATVGAKPSSAAYSTREPSRELPPSSAGRWSNGEDRASFPNSSRRVSSLSRERGVVLDMVDEEMLRLRPAHKNQIAKVEDLKKELKAAREKERHEAIQAKKAKDMKADRRLKVTSIMQAAVRGWLVRKRVIAALNHRTLQNTKHAAMLPDMLRDQLMQLQHGVHDLKYRSEERLSAAVYIQSWWRGTHARRATRIAHIAWHLQLISWHMNVSAIKIQAWFRMRVARFFLLPEIKRRMEYTRLKQLHDMETALCAIIQIQRGFRAKLARRRLLELEETGLELEASLGKQFLSRSSIVFRGEKLQPLLIDTWKPATVPGAEPVAVKAGRPGHAGVIIRNPPRDDKAIDKIEARGLVPFYSASDEQVICHQIGGPRALMMQQQLFGTGEEHAITDDNSQNSTHGGTLALCDIGPDNSQNSTHGRTLALCDIGHNSCALDDVWDMYPDGLTQGFLPSLDPDVWEKGGRAKSYRNSLRIRGARKPKRRRSLDCKAPHRATVLVPPPSNTAERAATRDERKHVDDGTVAEEKSVDIHPMFINAPALPPPKAPPSARSARFYCAGDQDLGLWGEISLERKPAYRSERRSRGTCTADESSWNTLNVPELLDVEIREIKRYRPGEISHERVWSIARSLEEKLPAITAG